MTTEILTYQSNDFVEYFPYHLSDGKLVGPTTNCEGRSIRASEIANLDINFGSLYFLNANSGEDPHFAPNSTRIYTYHCWNRSGDNIFDSVEQLKALGYPDKYYPNVGEKVLVADASYLQYLLLKPGNHNQKTKNQMEISKEIKKIIRTAKLKGFRFLYLENFAWKPSTGFYMSSSDFKISVELCKKNLEKSFSEFV
jgi:hypothetical protein